MLFLFCPLQLQGEAWLQNALPEGLARWKLHIPSVDYCGVANTSAHNEHQNDIEFFSRMKFSCPLNHSHLVWDATGRRPKSASCSPGNRFLQRRNNLSSFEC